MIDGTAARKTVSHIFSYLLAYIVGGVVLGGGTYLLCLIHPIVGLIYIVALYIFLFLMYVRDKYEEFKE